MAHSHCRVVFTNTVHVKGLVDRGPPGLLARVLVGLKPLRIVYKNPTNPNSHHPNSAEIRAIEQNELPVKISSKISFKN